MKSTFERSTIAFLPPWASPVTNRGSMLRTPGVSRRPMSVTRRRSSPTSLISICVIRSLKDLRRSFGYASGR
jgi:hypothetical protein